MAVLRNLKQDAEEELKRLRAENEALKAAKANKPFSMKLGQAGGMSAYMGSRYPVTLYYEQWLHLLDHVDEIKAWLVANKSQMKMRDNGKD